ncbi:MAG: hypothetical protein AAGJ08_09345 [Cyanobacteria bacterium P01_H01_bin.35]
MGSVGSVGSMGSVGSVGSVGGIIVLEKEEVQRFIPHFSNAKFFYTELQRFSD